MWHTLLILRLVHMALAQTGIPGRCQLLRNVLMVKQRNVPAERPGDHTGWWASGSHCTAFLYEGWRSGRL